MHNVCAEYTNAGYITVAINYTYMGKKFEDGEVCTFLTMNDEIKAAFAKVKEMSEQYGWNITKAATTGYSAGCHLALYYAYTHGNEQDAPIPVVFASGLVGPLDFHQEYWKDTPLSGPAIAASALNDPNIFDGERRFMTKIPLMKNSILFLLWLMPKKVTPYRRWSGTE